MEEHWDKLSGNVQNPDLDIAKERAITSSEVLVYKEISRERILGVLNLDLNKIREVPAGFVECAQETLEKKWSYPFAVCKFFLENPGDSDDLVEWCDYNIKGPACVKDIYRVCAAGAIYMALHPLSRDHCFIGAELIQLRSRLHEKFDWDWDWEAIYWRQKYLLKHQDNHRWFIDEDNDSLIDQNEEQQNIIEEL